MTRRGVGVRVLDVTQEPAHDDVMRGLLPLLDLFDELEQQDQQSLKNFTFPPSIEAPAPVVPVPSHCPFPASSLHFAFVHRR